MTKKRLAAVLAEHKKWLEGIGGKRADLAGACLAGANLAGANLACAYLFGADFAGADFAGADLDGAYLAGANLAGANLACAYLFGAYLDGANLAGANLARADFAGAKINDKAIIGLLRRATRSDGYEFCLWNTQEGYYVKAGCHFLDIEAARQHCTITRQGTPLGDESLDILDFFDAAIKRQGGAA